MLDGRVKPFGGKKLRSLFVKNKKRLLYLLRRAADATPPWHTL